MLVGFHCVYRNGKEKRLMALNREESCKLEGVISRNRAIDYYRIVYFSDVFTLTEWVNRK